LIEIIRSISFEANKIQNISEFSTKANFRLKTEELETDMVNYISEYVQNILPSINNKTLKIFYVNNVNREVIRKFKPIEVNILLDNILVNARKAQAKKLVISMDEFDNKLLLNFEDDGIGIKPDDIRRVFEFGFTTTGGSGLGLYHIDQIVKNLRGKIEVENNKIHGVTFKIII